MPFHRKGRMPANERTAPVEGVVELRVPVRRPHHSVLNVGVVQGLR